ncbi:hypothetical protein ACVXHA_17975 [Escherichia coli]
MVDFVSCVQQLSRGLLPAFQAGSHPVKQDDFIARTYRNHRVVLFSTFDVVIRECFGRRTDSATDPCLTDFTGTHTGSNSNATVVEEAFSMPFPIPSRKPNPPHTAGLTITHDHFALDAVFAHKGHMTGNLLVDIVITQLAADGAGPDDGPFTGNIPPGFESHKHLVRSISDCWASELCRSGEAALTDGIFIAGDRGIGISAFHHNGFGKTAGGNPRKRGFCGVVSGSVNSCCPSFPDAEPESSPVRQAPVRHRRARKWSGEEYHRPVLQVFPVRRVPLERFSTERVKILPGFDLCLQEFIFIFQLTDTFLRAFQVTPDNSHFCTQLFNFSLRFLVQTLGFRNGGTLDFIVKGLIDHPGHIRRRFAFWGFCRRGFLQVHLGYHPGPAARTNTQHKRDKQSELTTTNDFVNVGHLFPPRFHG